MNIELGNSGCMPAGDFLNYELKFLSTDIYLRAVQRLLNITSNNMAAVLRRVQGSGAQVNSFSTPHDGVVEQSVWPLWQHTLAASGSQMR